MRVRRGKVYSNKFVFSSPASQSSVFVVFSYVYQGERCEFELQPEPVRTRMRARSLSLSLSFRFPFPPLRPLMPRLLCNALPRQDGTVLQSTVTSQLPGRLSAKGLQQRRANSNRRLGVRCTNGRFYPPGGSWSEDDTYEVLLNEEDASDDRDDVPNEGSEVSTSIQCVAYRVMTTGTALVYFLERSLIV